MQAGLKSLCCGRIEIQPKFGQKEALEAHVKSPHCSHIECQFNMPKADKECPVVKFVESKGSKSEYAVKAYEVNGPVCLKLCFPFRGIWRFCYLFRFLFLSPVQAVLELQSEKYVQTVQEEDVLQMVRLDQRDRFLFVFSSFTSPALLHCQKV